jgi:SAM-dependent methyltransferase
MNPLQLNPYENESQQARNHYKETLRFLRGKLTPDQVILDIGQRSPMTDIIEKEFGVKLFNTVGDLDDETFEFEVYEDMDVVIYSHTIEHQFNPLFTLKCIKFWMKPEGTLYIMVPSRGKLLWTKNHYHEIDRYRMGLLLDRAGFKIIDYRREKHWRGFWDYFKGARMFIRLFFEYSACYTCKIK